MSIILIINIIYIIYIIYCPRTHTQDHIMTYPPVFQKASADGKDVMDTRALPPCSCVFADNTGSDREVTSVDEFFASVVTVLIAGYLIIFPEIVSTVVVFCPRRL